MGSHVVPGTMRDYRYWPCKMGWKWGSWRVTVRQAGRQAGSTFINKTHAPQNSSQMYYVRAKLHFQLLVFILLNFSYQPVFSSREQVVRVNPSDAASQPLNSRGSEIFHSVLHGIKQRGYKLVWFQPPRSAGFILGRWLYVSMCGFVTRCIVQRSSTDCFNIVLHTQTHHLYHPLPTHSSRVSPGWTVSGFWMDLRSDHTEMCFSLKVKGIKSEIHIFERFGRCLHFHTMHEFANDVAFMQHSLPIYVRQQAAQPLKTQTKHCAADWLTFQYLLSSSEFCGSGLTFWPPTKTSISQSSESYIQWLSHFSPSLFSARSFSPDGSWNESKLMNIITAS